MMKKIKKINSLINQDTQFACDNKIGNTLMKGTHFIDLRREQELCLIDRSIT